LELERVCLGFPEHKDGETRRPKKIKSFEYIPISSWVIVLREMTSTVDACGVKK
jgi:hypothetical protein